MRNRAFVLLLLLFVPQQALCAGEQWTWVTSDVAYDANTLFRFEPGNQIGGLANVPNFFIATPLMGFALDCTAQTVTFMFSPTGQGTLLFLVAPQDAKLATPEVAAHIAPLFPVLCPLRASLRAVTPPTDQRYPYYLDLRTTPAKFTPMF